MFQNLTKHKKAHDDEEKHVDVSFNICYLLAYKLFCFVESHLDSTHLNRV